MDNSNTKDNPTENETINPIKKKWNALQNDVDRIQEQKKIKNQFQTLL